MIKTFRNINNEMCLTKFVQKVLKKLNLTYTFSSLIPNNVHPFFLIKKLFLIVN